MELSSPLLSQIDPATPFADEVRLLARANAQPAAAQGGIVFYGSSSIRLWETLEQDFDGARVLNRGFGGSTLADCAREFDRLVAPLRPSALVLYAGDNDLDHGASPEHLVWIYETFLASVRTKLAGVPIVTISIKPSPVRFWNNHQIRRANQLLQETSQQRGVLFLDLYSRMLHEHGGPRRELFAEDGLHLSRAGYALWAAALRAVLPLNGTGA